MKRDGPQPTTMGQTPTLHLLYSCPFCWKVRGLLEHLNVDVNYVGVNGMKIKKEVAFAGDWGKVPVFTDAQGQHHVDSTPLNDADRFTTLIPTVARLVSTVISFEIDATVVLLHGIVIVVLVVATLPGVLCLVVIRSLAIVLDITL